ncbi:MAG: hypothetical protein KME26_29990 [Oscillatoria princeps RMCB-10]|nr:hypothetical protein [Oscillatoria princeps RMCB-10]
MIAAISYPCQTHNSLSPWNVLMLTLREGATLASAIGTIGKRDATASFFSDSKTRQGLPPLSGPN